MTQTATDLIKKIYRNRSPFDGFPAKLYEPDLQGWNSAHRFLSDSIAEFKPKIIVEVGVWKGGSTVTMAKKVKELGLDAAVIAIDTWLGSSEHWARDQYFDELCLSFGFPSFYYKFLKNIQHQNLTDFVVPLPLDSGNAAVALKSFGVDVDMIHIDAAHDYDSVAADLKRWWPLLKTGGIVVADDYDPTGKIWPSVKSAVDDFIANTETDDFVTEPYKARFRKR